MACRSCGQRYKGGANRSYVTNRSQQVRVRRGWTKPHGIISNQKSEEAVPAPSAENKEPVETSEA